ncbi:MAG: hypothetical protein K6B52_07760 [Clostridiales bacterium]|nr:hypothetical protein [Clostridiales bacterium]
MKQTKKCALGGIIAALSLAVMICVALVPFMTYALPAAAGALLVIIVIEIGKKWAFAVYAAVALLGIFLVPDKEVAAMYLAFFGYYPILKSAIEGHTGKITGLLLKVAVFLVTMIASYWLLINLMGISIDETERFGVWAYPILLGMGAFAFVMYDFVLTKAVIIYLKKWRRNISAFLK